MSSNNILADLQPQAVFKYFEQICAIPHGSGNVKKISDYLCEFAKERNLWFKQDESYNVIIKKPASDSESKAAPVILQGHIDMVAVKTDDKVKDMEKEGLDLYIEDGYVKADRTTLGADDGIAVAYALAILDSKDMSHPPIEAVFTVDEEVGMTGAEAINLDCLDGKIMSLTSYRPLFLFQVFKKNTVLQEFIMPWVKSSAPCPPTLWQRILLSSTIL